MSPSPKSGGSRHWFAIAFATLLTLGALAWWARIRFDPDRLWVEAQAALQAGLPRSAATNLAWIHRVRSPTSRDRMLEAQVAIAEGRADHALEALAKIPKGDPLAPQSSLLAGRLERERKHLHAAEAHFRRTLEADPNLVHAHRELIYIYGIQSRRPEVDAEFRRLSRLTELTHHDLYTWAFTQFAPHRPDDAGVLRAFVESEPEDRYSRLSLAEILLSEGGSPEEIGRLIAGLPESNPDVLATRAKVALSQGRPEEAERLLARGPADHGALNRLRGKLAILRRDYRSAVDSYRKVQGLQPYDRVSTLELGQALALAGQKEAAATYLDRSRHLAEVYNLINGIQSAERENRGTDLVKIARAFEAAGLIEESRHWFELAVRRDPLDVEAQAGLRRIRSLEREATAENRSAGVPSSPPGKSARH